MRRCGQRAGFCRPVELLVVLLIVAVLAGMLFPAIHRVREAAARANCMNNLKQIALAAHNYAYTDGYLPTGTIPNERLEPHERISWIATLLPYIE